MLQINFKEEEIRDIEYKAAYTIIPIKEAQKCILNHYNVTYDISTINELHKIRNSLFHGSDYEYTLLRTRTNELYDLISNALLKMLGWNGTSLNRQKNKFVKIN